MGLRHLQLYLSILKFAQEDFFFAQQLVTYSYLMLMGKKEEEDVELEILIDETAKTSKGDYFSLKSSSLPSLSPLHLINEG